MKTFIPLRKLQKGDKIAIVSPSFAAPAVFPEIYDVCLDRLRNIGLIPVEYFTTSRLGASQEARV